TIEQRLTEMADPRGRSRLLNESVAKEDDLRRHLDEIESQDRQLTSIMRQLENALAEFASLDEELATARARHAASEKDYRAYVEHLPVAELLDRLEAELREVSRDLASRRERLTQLDDELKEA